ncbi:thioredoxin family protein [Alienimonas chondri]|uniref:Thiol-disulfide oxidoreductase ResA n=1 Tax=Alienimonas chondri TaxID=2681879 RepID=A0ABX1VHU3_9PLAN|nr:thioredoxin family protein [Alienimonas chondri]NNJ27450.1 Thiol-disulfide oxidoreductase ResA [Alienimonas chondri]
MLRSVFVRSLAASAFALTLGAVSGDSASASEFNEVLDIGDKAPSFENLPSADGKKLSLADLKDQKAIVVVFTCNHCPVAQAYEGRMKAFAKEYADKGVSVVAISVSTEPEDALPEMAERVKAEGINYPYLRDETQAIGKAYGASVTPQSFVLGPDRTVRYMGAWDDSWRAAKAPEETYVRDAVDAVLAGKDVAVTEKRQVGCGIVYE